MTPASTVAAMNMAVVTGRRTASSDSLTRVAPCRRCDSRPFSTVADYRLRQGAHALFVQAGVDAQVAQDSAQCQPAVHVIVSELAYHPGVRMNVKLVKLPGIAQRAGEDDVVGFAVVVRNAAQGQFVIVRIGQGKPPVELLPEILLLRQAVPAL